MSAAGISNQTMLAGVFVDFLDLLIFYFFSVSSCRSVTNTTNEFSFLGHLNNNGHLAPAGLNESSQSGVHSDT
jgi:hypothetical protein